MVRWQEEMRISEVQELGKINRVFMSPQSGQGKA